MEDIKKKIIEAFNSEFSFIADKFEIMDLLENSPMDYETIDCLKLPSEVFNIVFHPGVYVFLGNNSVYKVGSSMTNSRRRVMQHLEACTSKNGCGVWDIEKYEDKSILVFNVRELKDRHWILSIEAFFEQTLNPLIKSGRIG